jgi:hypothetical protein
MCIKLRVYESPWNLGGWKEKEDMESAGEWKGLKNQ